MFSEIELELAVQVGLDYRDWLVVPFIMIKLLWEIWYDDYLQNLI